MDLTRYQLRISKGRFPASWVLLPWVWAGPTDLLAYGKRWKISFLCSFHLADILHMLSSWCLRTDEATAAGRNPDFKFLRVVYSQEQVRTWGLLFKSQWGTESCQITLTELRSGFFPCWALRWETTDPELTRCSFVTGYRARDTAKLCLDFWSTKIGR